MNKESLKGTSRSEKIALLSKLASGEIKIDKSLTLRPVLEFQLQENSKYECKQNRRLFTIDEIGELRFSYPFNRPLVQYYKDGLLPNKIILEPFTEADLQQTDAEKLHWALYGYKISHISDIELDRIIEEFENKEYDENE